MAISNLYSVVDKHYYFKFLSLLRRAEGLCFHVEENINPFPSKRFPIDE